MDKAVKQKIVIAGAAFVAVIAIVSVIYLLFFRPGSPYGNEVAIKDFHQRIKNLPDDRRQAIGAALYNMVRKNTNNQAITPSDIGEAIIRANSETQRHEPKDKLYVGQFVVDIEKVEQSYRVEYRYAESGDSRLVSGYPVVVACLPKDQLVYPPFECKGTADSENTGVDPLIQHLPYRSLTFNIDSEQGKAGGKRTLRVTLRISQSQLKGDEAAKRAVVADHKKQVADWIRRQGGTPANYTILYNYSDTGERDPNFNRRGGD